ncbi:hypothetical protein V6N11_044920 [Hibiscus sabdariffa]|uniref:Uncharacterized protein n=1 Tax=Hibiscus sabdariffa TaxID=183260 RepID=A0ABR2PUK2_9ROSI
MYRQETLLEFRVGEMLLDGKRVVPDTRKGLIRIAREPKAVDDSQLCIAVNNFINQPLVVLWVTRVQNEFTCIARISGPKRTRSNFLRKQIPESLGIISQ